jgi:hypothetical protein
MAGHRGFAMFQRPLYEPPRYDVVDCPAVWKYLQGSVAYEHAGDARICASPYNTMRRMWPAGRCYERTDPDGLLEQSRTPTPIVR